jgi:hypothetical protein
LILDLIEGFETISNGFRLTVSGFIDIYLLSPRSADTSFPYSEPPLNPIKQASSISVEAFFISNQHLEINSLFSSQGIPLFPASCCNITEISPKGGSG